MGSYRRGRSDVIISHRKGAIMAPETLLAGHRKLSAQKYDGFRKAPDGAFADRQRDRSLDRAHGGRIAAGARRCRLSCSKGAADSGRTTRYSENVGVGLRCPEVVLGEAWGDLLEGRFGPITRSPGRRDRFELCTSGRLNRSISARFPAWAQAVFGGTPITRLSHRERMQGIREMAAPLL